jgi:isoleucyl-tRNA synthetase
MAPILSFTAEEIWMALPQEGSEGSVHLAAFPEADPRCLDDDLEKRWNDLFLVRGEVSRVLEQARRDKVIGLSLDSEVDLYLSESWFEKLKPYEAQLAEVLIVSAVSLNPLDQAPGKAIPAEDLDGVKIVAGTARGEKCERCWNYRTDTGEDSQHPGVCRRCTDVVHRLERPPV